MKTATRYLEKHMVRDLATVTGGRYRRVRVDDTDARHRGLSPEKDDWVAGHRRSARARSTSSTSPPDSGSSGS